MGCQRLGAKTIRRIARDTGLENIKHGTAHGGYWYLVTTFGHHHFWYHMKSHLIHTVSEDFCHYSSCPGHVDDDGAWRLDEHDRDAQIVALLGKHRNAIYEAGGDSDAVKYIPTGRTTEPLFNAPAPRDVLDDYIRQGASVITLEGGTLVIPRAAIAPIARHMEPIIAAGSG